MSTLTTAAGLKDEIRNLNMETIRPMQWKMKKDKLPDALEQDYKSMSDMLFIAPDRTRVRKRRAQKLLIPRTTSMVERKEAKSPPGRKGGFYLLPDSRFRVLWDSMILLMFLYIFIVVPVHIAFDFSSRFIFVLNVLVDVCFILDVVLLFFTAYEDDKGEMVTDLKRISLHYIKTWFAVDFISAIPFFLIFRDADAGLIILIRMPRLARVVRLLRIPHLQNFFLYLEFSPRIHPSFVGIAKLLLIIVSSLHLISCLWYLVGASERYGGESLAFGSSWLVRRFGDESSFSRGYRYITSFYWTVTTLSTVGYGDITAQTVAELLFASMVMLAGTVLFSYSTALISSSVQAIDQKRNFVDDKMNELRRFVRSEKTMLPPTIKTVLFRQMNEIWTEESHAFGMSSFHMLQEIPAPLVYEVIDHIYDAILNQGFLHSLSEERYFEFKMGLLRRGVEEMYYYDTFLANEADHVDKIFIVLSGAISMSFTSQEEQGHSYNTSDSELEEGEDFARQRRHVWKKVGPGSVLGHMEVFGNKGIWFTTIHCLSDLCRVVAIDVATVRMLAFQHNLITEFEQDCRSEMETARRIKSDTSEAAEFDLNEKEGQNEDFIRQILENQRIIMRRVKDTR